MQYELVTLSVCDMCGSNNRHDVGLRLNGSTGLKPRKAYGVCIPVKQCADCELIYTDPMPIPVNIDDHYDMDPEDYFEETHLQEWPAFDNSSLSGLLEFRSGMKAVDVGAGVGMHMISLAKAGWDTWGIEPSANFVRFGIDRLGIDPSRLLTEQIETSSLPTNAFDLVIFGAVLEHLPSPAKALETALRILKPGGIVLADIPSSRFLLSRLINLFYRLNGTPYVTNVSPMHPPFHLYEFSHRSFEKNGERSGYELARHMYWVTTLYNVPKRIEPWVRSALARTGRGDGLRVYLRKL